MSLIAELKRRSVFKVGAAYLVVAWLAAQAAGLAFPTFEAPVWALRVFMFVLALGFPIALVLAWTLEVTPEGVKLDPAPAGNKRMYAIGAGLAVLAVGWFWFGAPAVRELGAEERSIAVLPFVNMSSDKENEYFSRRASTEDAAAQAGAGRWTSRSRRAPRQFSRSRTSRPRHPRHRP